MNRRNSKTALKIIERIFDDYYADGLRTKHVPAYHDDHGNQVFFGPYQAFRLNDDERLFHDAVGIAATAENCPSLVQFFDQQFEKLILREGRPVSLPTVAELKASIKQQRSEGRKTDQKPPVWMLGPVIVNAKYLLEVLQILPGEVHASIGGPVDPVFFWTEDLDNTALLYPRRG